MVFNLLIGFTALVSQDLQHTNSLLRIGLGTVDRELHGVRGGPPTHKLNLSKEASHILINQVRIINEHQLSNCSKNERE